MFKSPNKLSSTTFFNSGDEEESGDEDESDADVDSNSDVAMETNDQDDSLMEDLSRAEAVEEWAGIDVVSWEKM